MNEIPSVLVSCPMSYKRILPDNREFFTGVDWVASVSAQDYPQAEIYILANDMPDSMHELIAEAFIASGHSMHPIYIDRFETGNPPDIRQQRRKFDKERGQERFTRFALVRNMVLDHFLAGDWDYLVSIDSDVMVHSDCVTRLITQIQNQPGYGIIGGIVNNMRREQMQHAFGKAVYNFGEIIPVSRKDKKQSGRASQIRKFKRGDFLTVGYTGACAIYDGKMLRENPDIRWGANRHGEDIYFCEEVTKAGFKIGVDTTIVTLHMMDDTVYLKDRETFERGDFV